MDAYRRLAPFIQDYIYENGWEELRGIQVAACEAMFQTDDNILLTSGTASGKTEAAFLPALTLLHENPSSSVGILYVSPLKALINDQFERLNPLIERAGLPVCKWHGDAPVAGKFRMLAEPRGVIQITPESLESLVMRRGGDCAHLFADLRYIVIDEVHAFMGSVRGAQLLCLIERLQRLTGIEPRRLGLSATLSDHAAAEKWLSSGATRKCVTPEARAEKKIVQIRMEQYYAPEGRAALYESFYRATLDRKAIVFVNSRSEAEDTAAGLKAVAAREHTRDMYRVHHGSLSAALREDAEREMKYAEEGTVACATLTLELGVDIGRLDVVCQLGAPYAVSSLVQRMGRCGRRGQRARLLFAVAEKCAPEDREMPWELLRGAAILELYLRDGWTETARAKTRPYGLLFQQTLSLLYAGGEMSAPRLARAALTLSPLSGIPKEDFVTLARHCVANGYIQKTERGDLMLGLEGERLCNHYEFFAAFQAEAEMEVRCGNEVIGTVTSAFQPGDCFRLAGRAWQVIETGAKALFVREAQGAPASAWDSLGGASLDEKIALKMRALLLSDDVPAYMSDSCRARLREARLMARESNLTRCVIVKTPTGCALYPFMDARKLMALSMLLPQYGVDATPLPDRMAPIGLLCEGAEPTALRKTLQALLQDDARPNFPSHFKFPGKYEQFAPRPLREKGYLADELDLPGMRTTLLLRLEGRYE